MSNKTVTISETEYRILIGEQMFLDALRQAGVDNWEGYGEACYIFNQWEESQDEEG